MGRCVAAPDSLKSETFCSDLKIVKYHTAELPTATPSDKVHLELPVSDAEDLSPKPREALGETSNIDLYDTRPVWLVLKETLDPTMSV